MVRDWVVKIDMSPQTKLAARFKPILQGEPDRIDWETMILDMIDQVRSQPDMDPVLRLALLRNILQIGLEGSDPLQQALDGFKKLVDQADIDTNVPWMDPENREAEQMRPKAAAFFRSLPDLSAAPRTPWRTATPSAACSRPARDRSAGWPARATPGRSAPAP